MAPPKPRQISDKPDFDPNFRQSFFLGIEKRNVGNCLTYVVAKFRIDLSYGRKVEKLKVLKC